MSIKAKVTLIRTARLQVKGLLRGQQGTGSRTSYLPSEMGCRANISISRKLIREHPLILSVHFPRDKLSILQPVLTSWSQVGRETGKMLKTQS